MFGDRREIVIAPNRGRIDQALNRLALRGERWIVSLIRQCHVVVPISPVSRLSFDIRSSLFDILRFVSSFS